VNPKVQTLAPTVKVAAAGEIQPAVLARIADVGRDASPAAVRARLELLALSETCANFEPGDAAAMLVAFDELRRANVELAQAVDLAKQRDNHLREALRARPSATILDSKLQGVASAITLGIFENLNDRRGLHLDGLDAALQVEIRAAFEAIVLREFRQAFGVLELGK
jgi:ABC-type branched-subunit amino acid transport system ATPase component